MKLNEVYILTTKYKDEDTEIAGVYDGFDTMIKGFRKLLVDQPVYPAPTEKELDDMCADLEGTGPDDECDFHGCIFGYTQLRVHYRDETEEEYNGEAKGDDSD